MMDKGRTKRNLQSGDDLIQDKANVLVKKRVSTNKAKPINAIGVKKPLESIKSVKVIEPTKEKKLIKPKKPEPALKLVRRAKKESPLAVSARQAKPAKRVGNKKLLDQSLESTPLRESRVSRRSKKVTKNDSEVDPEVVLPNNASLRIVEKSFLLRLLNDREVEEAFYKISRVASICFLIVGITILGSGVFLGSTPGMQTAQLVKTPIVLSKDSPVVLLTPLPRSLNKPLQVEASVRQGFKVMPVMVSLDRGGLYKLPNTSTTDDIIRFTIPARAVESGRYTMRFYVRTANQDTTVYQSITFKIISSGDIDTERIVTAETSSELSLLQGSNTMPENIEKIESANLSIKFEVKDTIAGTLFIPLTLPEGYGLAVLYLRTVPDGNEHFITRASERNGQAGFLIDTTNLANGQYDFVAKATYSGQLKESEAKRVTVNNVAVPLVKTSNPLPMVPQKETSTKTNLVMKPTKKDSTFVPTVDIQEDAQQGADDLLLQYETQLEVLLRQYSEALSSQDPANIDAVEYRMEEFRARIVLGLINDYRLKDLSEKIDIALEKRITEIKERTIIFNKISQLRELDGVMIDDDGDGISNDDEIYLYGTDPQKADTDGDGLSDGEEILKGTDPTDPSTEAIIKHESPKQTVGLQQSEILSIADILPVTPLDDGEQDTSNVRPEIIGQALPNSYVTLYVYSTPTVVTVRTSEDGSFSYIFDNELEDGQHEVYVAMTDSAGRIVAQSSPFTFVKQAQAFTPVDALAETPVTANLMVTEANKSYGTVVGMGVLSLGIILFIVGIGLRRKEDEASSAPVAFSVDALNVHSKPHKYT